MNRDLSNNDVSNEGPNDHTVTGSETVPHAENDETGAELAQGSRKGPRTAKGKNIASRNALKHGIFSKVILFPSESRERYDSLLAGLWEHFRPIEMLEEVLVEKLAVMIWRYRRLISAETAEIEAGEDSLGFLDSNVRSDVLGLFPRYEASIERGFDRTLTQLERVQRMRRGQPVAPPIKLDISS
jgi:hypothetical protein